MPFTAIDLSRLPPPQVIEPLSYEAIFAEMRAAVIARIPDFEALLESDPAVKVLQICAWYRLLDRQRVNDAARARMLAFATGADLDAIGVDYGVARLTITPANAQTGAAAVKEGDEDFRRRIALAPEGFSVAGPEGAYVYHALSASGDVLDASAVSPAPGEVVVSVLSRTGNGAASAPLLAAVEAVLLHEDVRPMTDLVTVQSAAIVDYAVVASLRTFAGPDAAVVLAEARARLDAWIADQHRIGRDITRAGIIAALMAPGVQNVTLASPAADLVIGASQAATCTAVTLTHAGLGE